MGQEKKEFLFTQVFCGGYGPQVLAELKKMCGYDSPEFIRDPRMADFVAGRRSIAAEIINIINNTQKGEKNE